MRITFPHTGNVYLNAGIVGIAVTLENFELWRAASEPVIMELPADYSYGWAKNALWIDTEEPIALLERLYELMGRKYYNSSTKDALANRTNYWYEPEADKFHSFPKMKTYGFGALLTNDAAGKTPREDNTIRRKSIKPDDAFGQHLEKRYLEHFEQENLKLGQQLYVNEPYAKITRFSLDEKDLIPGKKICPLTGEGYKKLYPATSVSPTAAGLTNFLPGLSRSSDKIGWKAMYMIRFAPVLEMYRYAGGLDTLYCYFYDHPRLKTLHWWYTKFYSRAYLDPTQKQEANHLNNIKLKALNLGGKKQAKLGGSDFVHPNEILFQLIFTLSDIMFDIDTNPDGTIREPEDETGLNLYLLRAEKFAGTMRPNTFTAFNHFSYVSRYIRTAKEKYGIDWGQVLASLRIHLPSKERDWNKERLPREAVLKKLMHGQSFLEEIKTIFLGGLTLRLAGEPAGYKRWDQLAKLVKFNEFGPLNNYTPMDKDFREKAYKLGTQIGQAILNSPDGGDKPSDRAKFGRKYIIDLDKSRTYEDLLEAIKRIQLRYSMALSKELIIDPDTEINFRTVKLLATIGALNTINGKLSFSQKEKTPA